MNALFFPDTEQETIKIIENIVNVEGWSDVWVSRKRLTPQQQQKDVQIVVIASPGAEIIMGTRKEDLVLVNVYSKDLEKASVISRRLAQRLQNTYVYPVEKIRVNSNPARVEWAGEETFYASNYFVWLLGNKE